MTSTSSPSTRPPFRSLAAHIGLTSQHALAARRQAEREESRGELETATKHWTLALTIEPMNAGAWRGLSRCLRTLGRTIEADLVDRARTALEERTRP